MKFVFTESFNIEPWNGYIARYRKGISGSHNASMFLAEELARLGHTVEFVSINNKMLPNTYLKVKYINYEQYEPTDCDYIIMTYEVNNAKILNKISSFKNIIVLMNCDLSYENNINYYLFKNLDKDKIIIAYLSNNGKKNILSVPACSFLSEYNNFILPDSINTDEIFQVNISQKSNLFSFFPCLGRGYKMATEIVKYFENFKLLINTYAGDEDQFDTNLPQVLKTRDTSKFTIYEGLFYSKYFVYPLINMNTNEIHYDTFGYVVLEALLHGVVVIAPRMEIFEELYGDAICYVESDGIIDPENLVNWKKIDPNFGYPIIHSYAKQIMMLENNPSLHEDYVKRGLNIKDKFCNKRIAAQLLGYLSNSPLPSIPLPIITIPQEPIIFKKEAGDIKTTGKTIVGIFAGRENRLSILVKYLKLALERKIIDEVHVWDYTKKKSDEEYLKNISNIKRTSSKDFGNYVELFTPIKNNSIELKVKAPSDIHIVITDGVSSTYEFVVGGWNNTKSLVRYNGMDMESGLHNDTVADKNNHINIKIIAEHGILRLLKNENQILSCDSIANFEIQRVFIKTGMGSVGDVLYEVCRNPGFFYMDTCTKENWSNFYNNYSSPEYSDDIILKCDDDIVFMDLDKLQEFIDYRKQSDEDLVFANIINNGVSSYYQQNKYKLIPDDLIRLEYPPICSFEDSLLNDAVKPELLHQYFTENYRSFIEYPYNKEIIPINCRFSINFFGYKGKDWHKIENCGENDEEDLTVNYVLNKGFRNVMYTDFYVSHLSFWTQEDRGMNGDFICKVYDLMYNKIHPV